ncbi:YggS family pyridoxal phosphate-dependent enzyme [Chitinophaga solisilvae]|uniref:YggS family pyridoxal phosphate-dependent enzyme n=1 Tax=Chitinophaga solisilvae TaxID=1233460 RepID=UPI00136C7059|nr:YggS family pyridoxal phosphate-dependent enzyme [Chitinophaga solisilvae]
MSDDVLNNIRKIKSRIEQACIRSHRSTDSVKLLLATKTVPAERISVALQAGHTLIAENKIQELKEKYDALKEIPHENHFIGHLQTNKIRELLKYNVTCLQSLDRRDLAEKLHQRLLTGNQQLDVLIQVNTSGEESKFGVLPEETLQLVEQVSQLTTLKIKGLMTIGLLSTDTGKVRHCFRLLSSLRQQVIAAGIPDVDMKELSMGMSGDLEIAVEEGATIVRVGTAVFGQRPTPDSYYWNESATVS